MCGGGGGGLCEKQNINSAFIVWILITFWFRREETVCKGKEWNEDHHLNYYTVGFYQVTFSPTIFGKPFIYMLLWLSKSYVAQFQRKMM